MENIKLSPPWITFNKEISELFKNDKDVKLSFYENERKVKLTVKNYEKAQALKKILPKAKTFGQITVAIEVEYKSAEETETIQETYEKAFKDNPAFKYGFTFNMGTNPITYIVFAKEVVQYWNDDMSDPHGVSSTLYENIAHNVFAPDNGVIFSTDSNRSNGWIQKYYDHHATPEEINEWESHNGKGSFSDGSNLKSDGKEAVKVNSLKAFKSIFEYNKASTANKKTADDYPF